MPEFVFTVPLINVSVLPGAGSCRWESIAWSSVVL